MNHPHVILKDSTMREGLDVPGVTLDIHQKKNLLEKLIKAGIPEIELVAPGHFDKDLGSVKKMGVIDSTARLSGLIYGNGSSWENQIIKAKNILNRVDILIPLSDLRPPSGSDKKAVQMKKVLDWATDNLESVGIGFPHSTQVDHQVVLAMSMDAVDAGAQRITLYDTNGSSDPWAVANLIQLIRNTTEVEICFHAHNDMGMATANSVAAVLAGANCLDVTVNGLGDRAGNASLEQVAMILHLNGFTHGLRLDLLKELSCSVEAMTSIPVSKLAPIIGDFVFSHRSPSHLKTPHLFEPFDPAVIGAVRNLCKK